jgi:glycosyltransferase involved in cell wall biosynthesis
VIGSLYPRKNQLMVLRALDSVVDEYPETRLDLVGPAADERYQDRLQRFVRAHSLTPNVRFLGRRDDVPELLAQCDALVVGSHAEGLPHVVREAMHAGVPVVGTRVGGVPEAVEHGKTGFLVTPDDHEEMASFLGQLCADSVLCQKMGKKARLRAKEQFSQESWASTYNELLKSV